MVTKLKVPTHYATDAEYYEVPDEDYWVMEGERLNAQWDNSDEEEYQKDQFEWYGSND